ncbi:hypothetical protein [Mesorhizobium retamae]|uniref:Uncharacterized protein n=1 Tax=Mesorhizobium retamae TaxID=2912854 RepID=A0ABS9QR11_9HYPH|nr:hypothetical protein [Mesorhizobium sp. IRAMC:0171]MCG7509263.1 hypothetical protein [Mesorhizobium sp. IRAMC:0171]
MSSASAKQRLINVCNALGIPIETTKDDEAAALTIVSHLYVMPAIKEKPKRRDYGNSILQNAGAHFGANSRFVSAVGSVVIMMQEFPAWYDDFNKSATELAEQYQDLERAVYWLEIVGIGAGGSAVAAGVGKGIETGSVKEGAKKLGGRLAGKGAILEGIDKRLAARGLTRVAGIAGAVVVIGGTVAYYSALQEMEQIKSIMIHKFQNGEASDEDYKKVFGNDSRPELVKKYWEM